MPVPNKDSGKRPVYEDDRLLADCWRTGVQADGERRAKRERYRRRGSSDQFICTLSVEVAILRLPASGGRVWMSRGGRTADWWWMMRRMMSLCGGGSGRSGS